MSLSNFQKDIARAKSRQGGVFVEDTSGASPVWRDLGRVKGVEVSFSPVSTDPDTAGRVKQLAADVTITFVMQQTSDQELAAIETLTGAASTNGLKFKVTSAPSSAANAGTTGGYTFVNCLAEISGRIPFDASEGTMTVTVRGRVGMSELIKLGSTQTLTLDA